MPEDNPLVRLAATHPAMELWWDSSPLVYRQWLLENGRAFAGAGLFALPAEPGDAFGCGSILRGSTTNPPLALQVLQKAPRIWEPWVRDLAERAPRLTTSEVLWELYLELARRGASTLDSIFTASRGREGRICCQVDPRALTDVRTMVAQARRVHAAHPGIMIKMPGTAEGIEGVRILTAEAISTTVTLCFTVAQLIKVGEAVAAGLQEAMKCELALTDWRSCAVMMLGRYEDAPQMKLDADLAGVTLTESDLRWAGIAIFWRAHDIFRQRRFPSKLMAASMRVGPVVDGATRIWHLEKLAGTGSVLTIFPNIIEAFLTNYRDLPIAPFGASPVPEEVLERLLRIPYFRSAYEVDGLRPEQFVEHPALQATASSFAQSMTEIERFAARHSGLVES